MEFVFQRNKKASVPKQSRFAKFSKTAERKGAGFFNVVARTRRAPLILGRDLRRPIIGSGIKGSGRGRPRGSFNPLYAKYGGVYGYRKAMAHQRALERIQAMRASAITPQQESIIRNIEARQMMQQQAPENQTIPDTTGRFRLRSLHQEADDAANLVP